MAAGEEEHPECDPDQWEREEAVANGAEPASERKTVSGTVNRYLRLTTTGTFVNCIFAVAIRRGEAVDDEAYA